MENKKLSGLSAENIDTLLFDLDGTIIGMSRTAEFLFYLRAFKRFRAYFNPVSFYLSFWKSVRRMQANQTGRFNYDIFIEAMAAFAGTSTRVMEALTSDLVEEDFRALGAYFTPVPGARDAISLACKLGYRLVLATNPVVPSKSVLYRMQWAGIRPGDFAFISSSQNMTRCKPRVDFYTELLGRLELAPGQCLMIGNSPDEDLPARDAGIPTFLVETSLSKKTVRKNITDQRLDARGTYPDLIDWMKKARASTGA